MSSAHGSASASSSAGLRKALFPIPEHVPANLRNLIGLMIGWEGVVVHADAKCNAVISFPGASGGKTQLVSGEKLEEMESHDRDKGIPMRYRCIQCVDLFGKADPVFDSREKMDAHIAKYHGGQYFFNLAWGGAGRAPSRLEDGNWEIAGCDQDEDIAAWEGEWERCVVVGEDPVAGTLDVQISEDGSVCKCIPKRFLRQLGVQWSGWGDQKAKATKTGSTRGGARGSAKGSASEESSSEEPTGDDDVIIVVSDDSSESENEEVDDKERGRGE